jgi:hypothetical protein
LQTRCVCYAMADIHERKSGSGWGEKELDIYRFEKAPQKHSLNEFSWQNLFPDPDADPIADILSTLDDMFGPGVETSNSLNAIETNAFFYTLRNLIHQPIPQDIKSIPQTRSQAAHYSSPSLASANTQRSKGSDFTELPFQGPLNIATPCSPSHGTPRPDWLHRNTEVNSFSPLFEREQSPTVELMQRRGLEVRDPRVTPTRNLISHSPRSGGDGEPSSVNSTKEDEPRDTGYQLPKLPTSYGQRVSQAHISEINLPLTDSDSTYRPSSIPSPISSPAEILYRSSPPTVCAQGYTDQAEGYTNSMMYTLLINLCKVLSKCPTSASTQTTFHVYHNTDPLLVPTGDGAFIQTIPDLRSQRRGAAIQ